jgi:DNA ligase-1
MLLQYAANNEPYNKKDHAAFLKLDGIRLIVSNLDELKLYTRHNNDVTAKFPELYNVPFEKGTILDGELIVSDRQGKPDFEAMMQRFQSKSSKVKATFCAFDIIRYRGIDITSLPLHKRLLKLNEAFEDTEQYKHVQQANGDTIQYFEVVKKFGLEGIVIKDLNSKYQVDTRSYSWQKVINWTYADVFICGYKKDGFGWLTSILDKNGRMIPSGIIEFGVTPEHKKAFNSIRKQLTVSEDKLFVHLEPKIRVKVKTRNWTKNGMLRSPVFVEFII